MELWDAYDDQRKLIPGAELVRGEPIPKGMNHLVIHAWYINPAGELLIQQRAFDRPLAPGLWFCTGGSALQGEDTTAACIRETEEEMGFTPDMTKALLPISFKRVDAFIDVYMIPADLPVSALHLQKSEVADAKWAAVDEINRMLADGRFWHARYHEMLMQFVHEQYGV
ncbi:MAG: NUDIX domain-containing protein [Clostridia bacterium]|nr:NUDIX domain-containing protein [Clostridia bacterium]MBR4442787.1 NUDIX domain-containing protein [Clostridia bacterium]